VEYVVQQRNSITARTRRIFARFQSESPAMESKQ